MKKFLIVIFVVISSILHSQSVFDFSPVEYGSFKMSGQAICGLGNAFCTVTRSDMPNQFGNYTFWVYFSTNSYFGDCSKARTYITNIEVMYWQDGRYYYPANFYKFWITVGQTTLSYTLFHPNPNLQIKIRTGLMEPTSL